MKAIKIVLQNTSYLLGSFVFRKILTFIYFTIIARYTGVHVTGLYFLIISVWMFFSTLMDFGLSPIFIREISKHPQKFEKHFGTNLTLKAILCFVGSCSAVIVISVLNYPMITKHLVFMVIIGMVLESFYTTFYACLRGVQNMQFEAKGNVLASLLVLTLGSLVVWLQWNIYYLVAATVTGSLFNFLYSYRTIKCLLNLQFQPYFSYKMVKFYLVNAAPVFISTLFYRLIFLNAIVLSFFTNEQAVALFSIPSTFVNSVYFIAVAVSSALYPVMSTSSVNKNSLQIQKVFEKGFYFLALFIIPFAIHVNIVSDKIIQFLFGSNYGSSVVIMKVLVFSLIPIFFNQLIIDFFNAVRKQHISMTIILISGLVNIGMTIWLSSDLHGLGVAYAAVTSHSLFMTVGLICLYKMYQINGVKILNQTFAVLLAALISGLFIWLIKENIHILILVPLSVTVYIFALYCFEGATKNGCDTQRASKIWADLFQLLRSQ